MALRQDTLRDLLGRSLETMGLDAAIEFFRQGSASRERWLRHLGLIGGDQDALGYFRPRIRPRFPNCIDMEFFRFKRAGREWCDPAGCARLILFRFPKIALRNIWTWKPDSLTSDRMDGERFYDRRGADGRRIADDSVKKWQHKIYLGRSP